MKTPTIKDIAREAGVSHPTVSRALRNDPQISTTTIRRVQALAKRMGYRPNPALTALIAYRTAIRPAHRLEKLAVLCPGARADRLPAHIREQVKGIFARCDQLGFHPEIYAAHADPTAQKRLTRILFNRGVRGVLVTALPWQLSTFDWDKFCAVGIGENAVPLGLHYVSFDHDEAIATAYDTLRQRGYENIGFLNIRESEERNRWLFFSAYGKCRFLEGKEPARPLLYERAESSLVLSWLREHRFDALIGHFPIRSVLEGARIGVPAKMGLAGFATSFTEARSRRFASYVVDGAQSGGRAVDFLQSLMHKNQFGRPNPQDRYSLQVRGFWHEGSTIRPPTTGS